MSSETTVLFDHRSDRSAQNWKLIKNHVVCGLGFWEYDTYEVIHDCDNGWNKKYWFGHDYQSAGNFWKYSCVAADSMTHPMA